MKRLLFAFLAFVGAAFGQIETGPSQPYSENLDIYAGITPSANVQTFLGAANYAAMRTQLSLVPGTHVQEWDGDLDDLAALGDPGADRIVFWDDSASSFEYLTPGTGLAISSTTISVVEADIEGLLELADLQGDLSGARVTFADTDSNFVATNVQAALEELDDTNGSGPNAGDGKVAWTQLTGVPAGFADGSDDGSGGSSGTLNTIKEDGSAVGDPDIVTLDFLGADFDLTESPNTEMNIVIAPAITRDAEWDTIGEIETATSVNVIVSTEIDTVGEINTLAGDGNFVIFDGAGGTPTSLTLTNATGLPISTGVAGLGTGVATWLATPSSDNLRGALTDETGSGGSAVFATNPTIDSPTLTGLPAFYNGTTTQGRFEMYEDADNGSHKVRIQVLAALAADYTLTLPPDDGAASSFLMSDGSGVLTFTTTIQATSVAANSVALGTDTTGNYAAGDAEGGAATSGDTATAFFSAGTIEHERGGLEADVSAYAGFPAINSGATAARAMAEGLAIDVTNPAGAAGDPTFAFDPTEFAGSRTWGDASTNTIVWTFDRLSGTDPTITVNSGSFLLSGLTLSTPLAEASGGTGLSSLGTGVATWLGTPSSANLRTAVTDETGTGSLMFTRTGVLRTQYINAGAMIARTTNGAAAGTTETTTNDLMVDTFDFDSTTSEGVGFWWAPPPEYDGGTITAKFHWTASTGSGTVTWSISARAFADDDAIDQALGTAQTVTDTLLATGDMHVSAATSAMTIAGTPTGNRPTYWQITRDVADTLSGDAKLVGVTIQFTESATEPSAQ